MSAYQDNSNVIAKGIVKAVFTLILIFGFFWFLKKISPVLTYLVISFVLVILGQPLKNFLVTKLKMRNVTATILVILIFILIFTAVFMLFIPLLLEQGKNLSVLNSEEFKIKISQALDYLNQYLQSLGIDILDKFSLKTFFESVNLSFLPGLLGNLVGMLGNLFIGLFSVLFISFFLLKDKSLTSEFMFKILPSSEKEKYLKVIENIKKLLANYLGGLLLQIFILFVIYDISLHLIGVANATIIAFVSALLNLIPYIGPLISLILMITLSITSQLESMDASIIFSQVKYILLMYVIAQLIDNFWTQPFIYSRSVRSHPLEIFLVILISAHLFGITGMILAVPAYTVLKILFKEFFQEYRHFWVLWK